MQESRQKGALVEYRDLNFISAYFENSLELNVMHVVISPSKVVSSIATHEVLLMGIFGLIVSDIICLN